MCVSRFDLYRISLVVKEQVDVMTCGVVQGSIQKRLTKRSDTPTNDVHVEADPVAFYWLVSIWCRKTERALVSLRDVGPSVEPVRVVRILDKPGVP